MGKRLKTGTLVMPAGKVPRGGGPMDEIKFVHENLKRATLRKISRRLETGAARSFPMFIGGKWSTQLVRLRRRNLQLSMPTAPRLPSYA